MQVDEIYHLAQQVHALLPSARVAPLELWECSVQYATADRIAETLEGAGFDQLGAHVVAEMIGSYLGGWGGRYGNLDSLYEAALTALNQQAGGTGETFGVQQVLEGELGVAHVACLIDWWLCREEQGEPEV